MKKKKVLFIFLTSLIILILLTFWGSRLRPIMPVILGGILLISLWMILKLKNRTSKIVFITAIILSILYIIFPIKIIIADDMDRAFFFKEGDRKIKIMPISYGLPKDIGELIDKGYFPGGCVTGLFDPRYVILLNGINNNFYFNESAVAISSDNYIVFSKYYNASFLPIEGKQYTLTQEDVENVFNILEPFLENQSDIRDLSEYKAQFIGYTNDGGEKILYANYFCVDSFLDWKNNFVMALDGGNCFFNVKVNLQTKEVFDFIVNGDA